MSEKFDYMIVVEGYMDVIMAHQAGYKNTVGVCGTAITLEQLKLLRYYVKKLYFGFDNDEAGRKATARAIPMAIEAGFDQKNIFVISWGKHKDAGEFFNPKNYE